MLLVNLGDGGDVEAEDDTANREKKTEGTGLAQ